MTLHLSRLAVALVAAATFAGTASAATAAKDDGVIRIGFITDMSGPYADTDGPGGLEAIKMAVADAGGSVLGKKIEVLSADHQNKADIAASKARQWIDQDHIKLLIGGVNSATALAMNNIVAEKKVPYINVAAASARLTNENCTPYTISYEYDTIALARGTGSAVVKQGGKSWFFLVADYAFGHSLFHDTSAVIKKNGGSVVGSVKHPPNSPDMSSYILQAMSSGAQVLGLANAGADTINSIKAAHSFGITKKMKLVGLLMTINDIHGLGLDTAKNLLMTDSWYWNMNDASRAFAKRFYAKMHKMPSTHQAADYSAASTFIKAVKAANSTDADKVMAQLKSMKISDFYSHGRIRKDGRYVHDMYLLQVKTPAESKGPWDYLKKVATIPGDEAFNSLGESTCPLVKKQAG